MPEEIIDNDKKQVVKRFGFTLAEVLITLGIIGVVAAITLPTLIQNYQKKQTVVQLKKAYSELSQAINMAQKDFGMMEDWDFANFPSASDRVQYFYDNFLKPNLKIDKYCAPSTADCWSDDILGLNGNTHGGIVNNRQGHNSFVVSSGYSVYYWLNASGKGGWFFVDLNGTKKPNIIGKDIFTFLWYNTAGNGIKPGLFADGLCCYGKKNPTREDIISGEYNNPKTNWTTGACSKNDTGVSCAALIQLDGWEIKDDYPW